MTCSKTLSSRITGCPHWSLKTCLHLNGQSISGASQRNFLLQPDTGSTGKCALTFCKTSLPPPHCAHFPLYLLDFAHVWFEREDNDVHIFDVLPRAAAVYIFSAWILGGLSFHGTPSHLLICLRQSQDSSPDASPTTAHCVDHSANCYCAASHPGSCQLRVHNSHTRSLIEVFERRLSLWQEQQLQPPFRPHIPRAPLAVLADSAHLIAEVYIRDHPFTANSRASQVGSCD